MSKLTAKSCIANAMRADSHSTDDAEGYGKSLKGAHKEVKQAARRILGAANPLNPFSRKFRQFTKKT